MNHEKFVGRQRQRRKFRVRNQLKGNVQRPRLSVFRSRSHLYCQIIDDNQGVTLVSASTRDKTLRGDVGYGGNCSAAAMVGKTVAEKALEAGIKQVRFDRGNYKFHGRVAAAATAAREAGLEF